MSIITNTTVVIHLPQISIYAPFNHCAGPIWIQNQNSWLKLGLWWRFKGKLQNQKFVAAICVPEGWEDTPFNPFDDLISYTNWFSNCLLPMTKVFLSQTFVTKKNKWKTEPCFVETLIVTNGKIPNFTFYTTCS